MHKGVNNKLKIVVTWLEFEPVTSQSQVQHPAIACTSVEHVY